jgi:hypothetical protein
LPIPYVCEARNCEDTNTMAPGLLPLWRNHACAI